MVANSTPAYADRFAALLSKIDQRECGEAASLCLRLNLRLVSLCATHASDVGLELVGVRC